MCSTKFVTIGDRYREDKVTNLITSSKTTDRNGGWRKFSSDVVPFRRSGFADEYLDTFPALLLMSMFIQIINKNELGRLL